MADIGGTHAYYRPYHRRYVYAPAPYYDSYAYAPGPYYYGGGPVVSFSFGGGGFRGGGWGHHHRHWNLKARGNAGFFDRLILNTAGAIL